MRMVFIFSRLEDFTTINIIQWLIAQGKEFYRFNTTEDLRGVRFLYHTTKKPEKENERWPHQISSFFFYGGDVLVPPLNSGDQELDEQVSTYLAGEVRTLLTYELSKTNADAIFGLSPFSTIKVNKLVVLEKAKKVGLNVPQTAVLTSLEDLLILKQAWRRVITKSIDDGLRVQTDKFFVGGQKTEEVTDECIVQMPPYFFPSLFQELVEKEYELRVFFFNGNFKSIAIFSQSSELSRIDSRSQDGNSRVRKVPYELPVSIEDKLRLLMKELSLNYGSIDLIVGADNVCYFLEVNPFGQLGFLSTAGNYHIEKQIAEFLI